MAHHYQYIIYAYIYNFNNLLYFYSINHLFIFHNTFLYLLLNLMNNYDIKKEKNMKNVKLNFDDKPEKPNFFAEYSKSRESE